MDEKTCHMLEMYFWKCVLWIRAMLGEVYYVCWTCPVGKKSGCLPKTIHGKSDKRRIAHVRRNPEVFWGVSNQRYYKHSKVNFTEFSRIFWWKGCIKQEIRNFIILFVKSEIKKNRKMLANQKTNSRKNSWQ